MVVSTGILLLGAVAAQCAPPQAVLDMLQAATEQLANADAQAFLAHFDNKTPGYPAIAQQVSALVAREGAACTIQVVRDQGDAQKQTLEIDWVMRVGASRRKHVTVNVTVERQRGAWKITRLTPADLFTLP
jgi:hypothetical protein